MRDIANENTEARVAQEARSPVPEPAKEDLTGRGKLVSNVLFNWAGHFVFIVAGFVLLRTIDEAVSQCVAKYERSAEHHT